MRPSRKGVSVPFGSTSSSPVLLIFYVEETDQINIVWSGPSPSLWSLIQGTPPDYEMLAVGTFDGNARLMNGEDVLGDQPYALKFQIQPCDSDGNPSGPVSNILTFT